MKNFKNRMIMIIISILLLLFITTGCNKKSSEKQLIGFTIFEKTTPIGMSQKITSLDNIDLNGFCASSDYLETVFSGNSYFNAKVDYSKLPGDIISSDSICLFVSADYYQAQNVNYKLFLYDIYLLNDGTYRLEYRKDVELAQSIGTAEIFSINYESKQDSVNYVFTYKLTLSKIANPIETVVKEFGINNVLLKEVKINESINDYVALENTEYIIITEKNNYIDENNEEQIETNYIFLTKKSEKKSYVFKNLNDNSRIINYVVTFKFTADTK